MSIVYFTRPRPVPVLLLKAKSRGDTQTPDMFGTHVETRTRKDGVVQKYRVRNGQSFGQLYHGTPVPFDKFRDPTGASDRGAGHDHQGRAVYLTSDPHGYGRFFARTGGTRLALVLSGQGKHEESNRISDSWGHVLSVKLADDAKILHLEDAPQEIRDLFDRSVGDKGKGQRLRDAVTAAGFDGLAFNEPNFPEGWEVKPGATTVVVYNQDKAIVTGNKDADSYKLPPGWSDEKPAPAMDAPGAPAVAQMAERLGLRRPGEDPVWSKMLPGDRSLSIETRVNKDGHPVFFVTFGTSLDEPSDDVREYFLDPAKAEAKAREWLARAPVSASVDAVDDDHPAPVPRRSIAHLSEADRAKWLELHRAQHETHYHEMGKVREEMDRVRSKRNKSETAMREAEAGLASQRKAPIADPVREREFGAAAGQHRAEFDKHARKLDELAGNHETLSGLRDRLGKQKDAIVPGSGDLRMNLMSGQRSTLREEMDAQKDYGKKYREHFKRRAAAERKAKS